MDRAMKNFAKMGCRMIETKVDRRGINPKTDLGLIKTYAHILKAEAPDMVITYSIKPNVCMGLLCRIKRVMDFIVENFFAVNEVVVD